MKVLIVDDNEDFAFILQRMLEGEGYDVRTAGDAGAAYGAYMVFKPDLVITDIQMPQRDGLELMRDLRMHNPGVKAIYMSADSFRFWALLEEEKKRYSAGLLQKPFSKAQLMRVLSEKLSLA